MPARSGSKNDKGEHFLHLQSGRSSCVMKDAGEEGSKLNTGTCTFEAGEHKRHALREVCAGTVFSAQEVLEFLRGACDVPAHTCRGLAGPTAFKHACCPVGLEVAASREALAGQALKACACV